MNSKKIDTNLDNLILNLKLTKPSISEEFRKTLSFQSKGQELQVFKPITNPYAKNQILQNMPQIYSKPLKTEPIESQYDSVVNDNYDDFNSYSFYELKQGQKSQQQTKGQEFSFCHQFEQLNHSITNDDSLERFSSIVDKLKTQGDQCNSRDDHFFYSYQEDNSAQVKTDRIKSNDQYYCSEVQQHKENEKRHTKYFSGSILKSTQKSYKTMTKKNIEPNLLKIKVQPIYAKLSLNNDKQNNHQNSNICPKISVISALSSKKSNYTSVIKKSYNPVSTTTVKPVQFPTNRAKVKQLNEKIRKENQIIYQSELKQKNPDISPLRSFKKSAIQPHKFSSYKVKLFG